MNELAPGIRYHPVYLDRPAQEKLVENLREIARQAPFFTPRMPKTGKPLSVKMTNCGEFGWVADEGGYRYQATHPETGKTWPPMPELIAAAWKDLAAYPHEPQACLVNFYARGARMGLHQDRDEADLDAPVVSLSLGETALFRIGGTRRGGRTMSIKLNSGDALVFGGPARLIFHGVDRILPGTSTLVPDGGRINLTLRRVTAPIRGG